MTQKFLGFLSLCQLHSKKKQENKEPTFYGHYLRRLWQDNPATTAKHELLQKVSIYKRFLCIPLWSGQVSRIVTDLSKR